MTTVKEMLLEYVAMLPAGEDKAWVINLANLMG